MKLKICLLISLLGFLGTNLTYAESAQLDEANGENKKEISAFLEKLYQARSQLLRQRSDSLVAPFYSSSDPKSAQALRQELNRSLYMQTWAKKRGLQITESEGRIRIFRLRSSGNLATASLIHSTKVSYTYRPDLQLPKQTFGFGTRHALTLKKIDGQWKVLQEYYLDPMDENPDLIPAESVKGFPQKVLALSPSVPDPKVTSKKSRYNRERAVAYANKYAGAAWGAGNKGRYNPKYRDYTYVGGDCTNFASQVVGDPEEGGGLRMTGDWRYWYKAGGSHTWVQTDRFKQFLLWSGYGRMVAKGSFSDVVGPSKQFPQGAMATLQPGDLIAYAFKGDVDHFSIVVGRDINGYPLVNSHTADRYHMPFDLGWDRSTQYMLIRIQDK